MVRSTSSLDGIGRIRSLLTLHTGDLCNLDDVDGSLADLEPEYIFHLAAQSAVDPAIAVPIDTMNQNVLGTLNLLETVRKRRVPAIILFTSSSNIYGPATPEKMPLLESAPINPVSPYAVSKTAADLLVGMYPRTYGVRTVRVRPFNHIGPRRKTTFVDAAMARQIAAIELGLQEPTIRTGNLDSVRTFTDVRDMVRAYWLAVTKGTSGEVYNVGSTRGLSVRELLDRLLALSQYRGKIAVWQDPALQRPSDVPVLIPDCSKFENATGWRPAISLERTLIDTLDYWRRELAPR